MAVTVDGLEPGRWAVFLTKDDFAGRPCYGRLARRTARVGRPTVFSGALPASTRCEAQGIPGEGAGAPPPRRHRRVPSHRRRSRPIPSRRRRSRPTRAEPSPSSPAAATA